MKTTSVCLFGEREQGVKRAFFEITNLCNMSCKHCMNDSGINAKEALKKEEIMQLFKELHNHQIRHLYISGGEPLLYYGIDEVLKYAHSLGMRIVLATNGLAINKHLPTIKNCVDTVSVSLDGMGKTHDLFRGVSGSFDHLSKMLDLLKREAVTTKMSTIIWKGNVNQLDEIVTFAQSKGIAKLNFNILVKTGRAKENQDIHIPSDEYQILYERVCELINNDTDPSFKIDMKRTQHLNEESSPCPGGKQMFHINAEGRVSPCSWLSKIDNTNEFSSKWEKGELGHCLDKCNNIDFLLNERKEKYGFGGCPALAKIHNGSYLSEDPLNERLNFI